ncbi:hypothetical protein [Sphaerisporangium sp. NPDC051011]|uniref:hypothetical protein n=1 Tax=Sphaerisporangium sp. NPDC051011 TaxID=3155792 RepID=UPI0033C8F310
MVSMVGTGALILGGGGSAVTAAAAEQVPEGPPDSTGVKLSVRLVTGTQSGQQRTIHTGDVLHFRVRFDGPAPRTRLAVAMTPADAPALVSCEDREATPAKPAPRLRICEFDQVTDGKTVDVAMRVPREAQEVGVSAIAHMHDPVGVQWIRRTADVRLPVENAEQAEQVEKDGNAENVEKLANVANVKNAAGDPEADAQKAETQKAAVQPSGAVTTPRGTTGDDIGDIGDTGTGTGAVANAGGGVVAGPGPVATTGDETTDTGTGTGIGIADIAGTDDEDELTDTTDDGDTGTGIDSLFNTALKGGLGRDFHADGSGGRPSPTGGPVPIDGAKGVAAIGGVPGKPHPSGADAVTVDVGPAKTPSTADPDQFGVTAPAKAVVEDGEVKAVKPVPATAAKPLPATVVVPFQNTGTDPVPVAQGTPDVAGAPGQGALAVAPIFPGQKPVAAQKPFTAAVPRSTTSAIPKPATSASPKPVAGAPGKPGTAVSAPAASLGTVIPGKQSDAKAKVKQPAKHVAKAKDTAVPHPAPGAPATPAGVHAPAPVAAPMPMPMPVPAPAPVPPAAPPVTAKLPAALPQAPAAPAITPAPGQAQQPTGVLAPGGVPGQPVPPVQAAMKPPVPGQVGAPGQVPGAGVPGAGVPAAEVPAPGQVQAAVPLGAPLPQEIRPDKQDLMASADHEDFEMGRGLPAAVVAVALLLIALALQLRLRHRRARRSHVM